MQALKAMTSKWTGKNEDLTCFLAVTSDRSSLTAGKGSDALMGDSLLELMRQATAKTLQAPDITTNQLVGGPTRERHFDGAISLDSSRSLPSSLIGM